MQWTYSSMINTRATLFFLLDGHGSEMFTPRYRYLFSSNPKGFVCSFVCLFVVVVVVVLISGIMY
jgi:hypothetical protein